MNIYITSFHRLEMTRKTIELFHERTTPGTFQIHVFDNASSRQTRDYLYEQLLTDKIVSLHLDSRNTGCLYNKLIFYAMTETKEEYYVVTDNDIYPPKLSPDWLQQMIGIMDRHPEIAFLTPNLPPVELMGPEKGDNEVIYCKAVGNALRMIRRSVYPKDYTQELKQYGDDGKTSDLVRANGFKVAYCKNIYCFHAGQCENWGYNKDEIALDPRKSGYGKPYIATIKNQETYEYK